MFRGLLIGAWLCSSGCAYYVVQMKVSEDPGGPDYVILKNGDQKVYDCLSRPDGERWDPTCVKVKLQAQPPK